MSQSKQQVGLIADGIATIGTVNSPAINVPQAIPAGVAQAATFLVRFTLGSVTSLTLTPQAFDGTNWFDILVEKPAAQTASGKFAIRAYAPGAKAYRLSYTAAGVATSSSIGVDACWQVS